jgi:hypothetical protein
MAIYKRGCDKKGANKTCSKCGTRRACGGHSFSTTSGTRSRRVLVSRGVMPGRWPESPDIAQSRFRAAMFTLRKMLS